MGHPSLSQVMEGKGMPEASQVRDTEFFSTTLIFSGVPWFPMMLGGAVGQKQNKQEVERMVANLYQTPNRTQFIVNNMTSMFWSTVSKMSNHINDINSYSSSSVV